MSIIFSLTEDSVEALDFSSELHFTHQLFDPEFGFDEDFLFEAFGAELSGNLNLDLEVNLFADLIVPGPTLDFDIELDSEAVIDQVVLLSEDVRITTSGYVFDDASVTSSLDLTSFEFSTGFDVTASTELSDIIFDSPLNNPLVIDGVSLSYIDRFELLGFGLTPDENGDFFNSDVGLIEDYLNNEIPVNDVLVGDYSIPGLPVDLNWNLNNLGYGLNTQDVPTTFFTSSSFDAMSSSGLSFANITLDLDDVIGSFLPGGSNPLLSPFELNFSAELFQGSWFETNFQLLATLLDIDLVFGLELVQLTEFVQTAATVTVYDNGTVLSSGNLGDTLSFAGDDTEGTRTFDLEYGLSGDVTTSWGIRLTVDAPVELLSLNIWEGALDFFIDEHGFTEPLVPEDAFGFVTYQNVISLITSNVFEIPGSEVTTSVDFITQGESFSVTYVDDSAPADPTDPTNVISLSANTLRANEDDGQIVFTINRTDASQSQTFFVNTESADGTSGASDIDSLTLQAVFLGVGVHSETVTVGIIDDLIDEVDEDFTISLENSSGDILSEGQFTVVDNDDAPPVVTLPELSVSDASVIESNIGESVLRFEVTLNEVSDQDVSFFATTIQDSTTNLRDGFGNRDYVSFVDRSYTISAGSTSTIVEVVLRNDEIPEITETMGLRLSSPIHATIADGFRIATGTIFDNDSEFLSFPNGEVSAEVSAGESLNYRILTNESGVLQIDAFNITGNVDLRVLDYLGNEIVGSSFDGDDPELALINYLDNQIYFIEISGQNSLSQFTLAISNPDLSGNVLPPDLTLTNIVSNGQLIGANDTLERSYLAGGLVDLELVVQNIGDGIAPNSSLEVFIQVGTETIQLANFSAASLGQGEDLFVDNFDFRLPENLAAGNYNLAIIIDRLEQIDELNEINNGIGFNLDVVPETVINEPVDEPVVNEVDIIISNASLRDQIIFEGDEAEIDYTVFNNGNLDIGTFGVGFTLSLDLFFGNEDDVFLEPDGVFGLDAGESDNGFDVLNFTSNLSAGTYYIFAHADLNDSIDESNEFNNVSDPLALIVQIPVPTPEPIPEPESNQIITNIAFVPEDIFSIAGRIDQGDRPTLSVTIENIGDGSTGSTQLAYYVSATPVFDDATLFGNRSVNLTQGETITETFRFSSDFTNSLPAGETYYFFAVANDEMVGTERDFSDNITAPVSLRIRGNEPSDLNVLDQSIDVATIDRGERPLLTVIHENVGDQEAGITQLGVYVSETTNFEDAVLVRTISTGSGLNNLSSRSVRLSAEYTETLTPGQTYYVFGLLNYDQQGSEVNFTNNLSAPVSFTVNAAPPPDQSIVNFEADVTEIGIGEDFILSYEISNLTNERTGETTLGFYVSETGEFSDAVLFAQQITEISAQQELVESFNLQGSFTETLQSGTTYTFFISANDQTEGLEIDFSNNISAGIDVSVVSNEPSDQNLSSIAVAAPIAIQGQDLVIGYSVENLGDRATGVTELSLYIGSSPDGSSATLYDTQNLSLLAGEFLSGEFILSSQNTLDFESGQTHYFFIVANDGRVGSELNFDNNQSDTVLLTSISSDALTITDPILNSDFYIQGLEGVNDRIDGTDQSDQIIGLSGNDEIDGNRGQDILIGGAGQDVLQGGFGDDVLIGGMGDDNLNGNLGDDVIEGSDGNDIINGNSGRDLIDGGEGSDTIYGGSGDDDIRGGDNDDILIGSIGLDTIYGGDGNDSIQGNSGNDRISGDEGIDTINGGGGNDIIDGGAGDDILNGSLGVDTIRGGEGDDTIQAGNQNDLIFGQNGNDFIEGGAGNDALNGGLGDDILIGGAGADVIQGNGGNDVLEGNAGGDDLFGWGGNDTLFGGGGNDVLNGGTGADIFIFSAPIGVDRIQDFQDDVDLIDLSDFVLADNFMDVLNAATQVGANVRIDFNANNSIILEDFNLIDLDESDFVF